MRRSRRIPLPLLAVLAVVLVEGLVWTFAVPALQGADESSHVGYVQKIADAHEIPWTLSQQGLLQSAFGPSVSSEQRTAWLWAGLEPLRGNVAARPLWTKEDEAIWRRAAELPGASRRTDGVGTNAFLNPPLYYLSAAVPYEIAGGSFFDRVFAMRLYGVALLVATVGLTWLLAGEVFGRRRELQTVAAAAVALQPVLLDTATRVTPDSLLIALGAAALYAMALVVNRGPSWRLAALLALAVAGACLTQGRGLGLVAPALFAIGLGWRRRRAPSRAVAGGAGRGRPSRALAGGGAGRGRPSRALAGGGAAWGRPSRALAGGGAAWGRVLAVLGAAAVVLVAVTVYATRWRFGQLAGFWSYLWQFYLPRLPGMHPAVGPPWSAQDVYLDRFLGTFVQFEVGFGPAVLDGLRVAIWAGLALLVAAAWRHRAALAERRDIVISLLVALVLVVLSLHAAAFRALLQNPADPVITGRYLLMVVPLFGLGVAAALTALPGRLRAAATGAVLAGGVLLQMGALGIVVARFYA